MHNISDLITTNPSIRGGRPICAGTGVTVERIAEWHKLGLTPEQALDRMMNPNLTIAHIYAALAYYYLSLEKVE